MVQTDLVADHFLSSISIVDILGLRGHIRILNCLAREGEKMISHIARTVKINHRAVSEYLKLFESANLVELKEFGRHKVYRFRIELERNQKLRILFEEWQDAEISLEELLGERELVKIIIDLVFNGEMPISKLGTKAKSRHKRLKLLKRAKIIELTEVPSAICRFCEKVPRNQTLKRFLQAWID